MSGSGAYARLFDFGEGPNLGTIFVSRYSTEDRLYFGGHLDGINYVDHAADAGTWTVDQWRHAVLTITPITQLEAQYDLYLDGALIATKYWKPLVSKFLFSNYLGKSNWQDGPYVGMMDSFSIYSVALNIAEITSLLRVSPATTLRRTALTLSS
jgi:hypothetical protein